jgi:hypothetical protein
MRSRTRHVRSPYMRVSEVAVTLEISDDSALRQLKSGAIPGGELVYKFEGRRGARWRVSRDVFEQWNQARKDRAANAGTAAKLAIPG